MNIDPIARLKTCYDEKFGIPRQPGLVKEAWGVLEFLEPYRNSEALRGLEGFSHLWLIFHFHQLPSQTWKPTVRPPRLGGNEKRGVFATRSPFRPNPIGLSVVEIQRVDLIHCCIELSGVDIVNDTPILDIKPYVGYSDSLPEASSGFAINDFDPLPVCWRCDCPSSLKNLIESTLALDPRPSYHQDERQYGVMIASHNVRWKVNHLGQVEVLSVKAKESS